MFMQSFEMPRPNGFGIDSSHGIFGGFGVNLPPIALYAMLWNVSQYAYDELKMDSNHSIMPRRRGRLCFRLAMLESALVLCYHSSRATLCIMCMKDVRKTVFQAIDGGTIPHTFQSLQVAKLSGCLWGHCEIGCFSFRGIKCKGHKSILETCARRVKIRRLDLFYDGIYIVFDTSKHKHHYIGNF